MKKNIFHFIIYSLALIGCGGSSTNAGKELTGNIPTDIKTLLPKGRVSVDRMGVITTGRQAELSVKMQAAIADNYDWFLEYMKTVPEGETMPWHENLGLTKEEYEELVKAMNDSQLVSIGKEDVVVEIKDDVVHFDSQGELWSLDSLTLDLKSNTAHFASHAIPFSDTVNITSDKNGFRSKWKGYSWQLAEPKDLQPDDLKDVPALNMKSYSLSIGRLERNGKVHLSFKAREVEEGERTVELELTIQF